jgi:hypothetical protein
MILWGECAYPVRNSDSSDSKSHNQLSMVVGLEQQRLCSLTDADGDIPQRSSHCHTLRIGAIGLDVVAQHLCRCPAWYGTARMNFLFYLLTSLVLNTSPSAIFSLW